MNTRHPCARAAKLLTVCGTFLTLVDSVHALGDEPPAPAAPQAMNGAQAADGPQARVTAQTLIAHIKALPTSRAAWGNDESLKGLRATEQLIVDKLKGFGLAPTLDQVDFMGHRAMDKEESQGPTLHNIIVDLPGTSAKDQVLIISAHIDAVPGSPGADDDGTGVAMLLEAARVLKDHPTQRSIRLCFFNLEEVGLVGSRSYAQKVKKDMDDGGYRVVGMISADMLGFYSTTPNSQQSPIPATPMFTPPTVGDFLAMGGILKHRTFSQALDKAMKQAEPQLKTVVADFFPIAIPDLTRSDHAPFWAINVPAVILADTANFRNPNYHKPTDTIDTLDQERFAIASRGIIGGVYLLAGPPGTALIPLAPARKPKVDEPAPAGAGAPGQPGAQEK